MPAIKPRIKRQFLRENNKFTNSLIPLIELPDNKSVKLNPQIINHLFHFVDSYQTKEEYNSQGNSKSDRTGDILLPKDVVTTKTTRQRRPRQVDLDYTEYNSDATDGEEVQMNYNASNTPKFLGKFVNIAAGNKVKRKCKTCGLIYNDLKGFNRHYQNKHLRY